MKEINYHIRDQVAVSWYDLGIQLSLDVAELNIIKINHPTDAKECSTKMFNHWLQVDTTASWIKLIEALRRINKNQIAEIINKDILQGNM